MPNIDNKYDLDPETDVSINPEELDVEWLRQPQLMLRYSRACDQAAKDAADVKNKLEVTRAEMATEVRKDPAAYGIDTGKAPTVDQVNNAVLLSVQYQAVEAELSEANHAHKMLSSAVRAIDMKKSALENAVRMATLGYFATPQSPRETSELARLIEEKSNKSAGLKVRSAIDQRREERKMKRGK